MSQDITKLPKWAQGEIERLNKNVAYYRDALYRAESGETDTRMIHLLDAPRYLQDGVLVEFKTRGGEWVGVKVNSDGRVLARTGGSGRLAVLPQSSNGVELQWQR